MADQLLDSSYFLPTAIEHGTIAQKILVTVEGMRKRGELSSSLCWPPEELELLAMFAIDAKLRLEAFEKKKPRRVRPVTGKDHG
jgi:hypothetical protein